MKLVKHSLVKTAASPSTLGLEAGVGSAPQPPALMSDEEEPGIRLSARTLGRHVSMLTPCM